MGLIMKTCSFIWGYNQNWKAINHVSEFNQSQRLKRHVEFNPQKIIEAEKNGEKDGKTFYKLMNNNVYGKTIESVRNRIDVRLVSN